MPIGHLIGQPYGHSVVLLLKLRLDPSDVLLGQLQPWPPEPAEGGRLGHSRQAADESAGRHAVVVVAAVLLLDGDGQSVADHDQVVFLLFGRHGCGR